MTDPHPLDEFDGAEKQGERASAAIIARPLHAAAAGMDLHANCIAGLGSIYMAARQAERLSIEPDSAKAIAADLRRLEPLAIAHFGAFPSPKTIQSGLDSATAIVGLIAGILPRDGIADETIDTWLDRVVILFTEIHSADLRRRIAARDAEAALPSASFDAGQTLH